MGNENQPQTDVQLEDTTPKPWWADPATYVMVLGLIVPVLNKKLGLNLDTQQVAAFLASVVAFFALHKWESGKVQAARLDHNAVVQATKVQAAAAASPEAAASAVAKL